jgi:TctA family transporter
MEEHFRRALLVSNGNFMAFFERPLAATILGLTFVLLAWAVWSALRPVTRG